MHIYIYTYIYLYTSRYTQRFGNACVSGNTLTHMSVSPGIRVLPDIGVYPNIRMALCAF